jgi:hypothetical protein
VTARLTLCALLVALRAQAASDAREVDPTRASALAMSSRAGVLLRTTTIPLLPDLRIVDGAVWATLVRTRVGLACEGTNARAAHATAWRASVDRGAGARLRVGFCREQASIRVAELDAATGRRAGAATVVWIGPSRGDRRWACVSGGASRAWGAALGWSTAPLSERTGAELACAVSTGALGDDGVTSGVRVSASAALALARSVALDVVAASDPAAVTWRLTWGVRGLRGEVERRSVLGFGDVRSWGGAWIARP